MDTGRIRIFGERLRARREQLGLRQQTLAQDMGAAQGWISELERGKQTRLEAETVYRFAQALRCSTDYLLGSADTPTPPKRPRSRTPAPVGEDRYGA
jgi:transcriptional regulator with XRE-family HTH domain